MVDFDALEAAGIADARERAPLIEYLDSLGFTTEDMADAERRGRLFGLAGDVLQWSGPPTYSLADTAASIGLPLAAVEQAWAALGLTAAGPDVPTLSQADVDGLRTWAEMRTALGEAAATGLLRVIGSGLARLSEAESSMVRAGSPDIAIDRSHDELATPVLALGGDYFGNPVNLAARLVGASEPDQILVSASLREALPEQRFAPPLSLTLKGFATRVTAYPLR